MPRNDFVRGCLSVLVVLIIWEILTRLLLENEPLIPPPSSVFRSPWKLASSGAVNEHFLTNLLEFISGFTVACIFGVVLGYLMGRYPWFDAVVDSWLASLHSVPVTAFVPLIIIWCGIGMLSKVIVLTTVAIALNTAAESSPSSRRGSNWPNPVLKTMTRTNFQAGD